MCSNVLNKILSRWFEQLKILVRSLGKLVELECEANGLSWDFKGDIVYLDCDSRRQGDDVSGIQDSGDRLRAFGRNCWKGGDCRKEVSIAGSNCRKGVL